MMGAQLARKTRTSSSLGIDNGVADVFRQGGGLPVARQVGHHGGNQLESFSYMKMQKMQYQGNFGPSPQSN